MILIVAIFILLLLYHFLHFFDPLSVYELAHIAMYFPILTSLGVKCHLKAFGAI